MCILGMGSATPALAKPSTHAILFDRLHEVDADTRAGVDSQTRNIIYSVQNYDSTWDIRAFLDWLTPEQMHQLSDEVLETLVWMQPDYGRFGFDPRAGNFLFPEKTLNYVNADKIYSAMVHGHLLSLHNQLYDLERKSGANTHFLGMPKPVFFAGLAASFGISIFGATQSADWATTTGNASQLGLLGYMFNGMADRFGGHRKARLEKRREELLAEVLALRNFAADREIPIRQEVVEAIGKIGEIPAPVRRPKKAPVAANAMRYRVEASNVISVLRDTDSNEIIIHLPDDLILELPNAEASDFEKRLTKVLPEGVWLRFPDYDEHFVLYSFAVPHEEFSPEAGALEVWRSPHLRTPAKLIRVVRTMGDNRTVPFEEVAHWGAPVDCHRRLVGTFWAF